jgi:hypothetical protein
MNRVQFEKRKSDSGFEMHSLNEDPLPGDVGVDNSVPDADHNEYDVPFKNRARFEDLDRFPAPSQSGSDSADYANFGGLQVPEEFLDGGVRRHRSLPGESFLYGLGSHYAFADDFEHLQRGLGYRPPVSAVFNTLLNDCACLLMTIASL